jgi:hypothetical protein
MKMIELKKLCLVGFMLILLGCQSATTSQPAAVFDTVTSASIQYTHYEIVDTGQTNSYDNDGKIITPKEGAAFYGQDGVYKGTPFKFVDNGDGTIMDKNTGLTWLKKPSQKKYTWQQAKEYAENLNFAGRDTWRLPTLKELISIEDFSEGWPYVDTEIFDLGDAQIGKHMQYWSNDLYKAGTTHTGLETAFSLNFATGHIKGYPTGNEIPELYESQVTNNGAPELTSMSSLDADEKHMSTASALIDKPLKKYAWAVRGNEYGYNYFVDNGNGTVSDLATGLMWMQHDSGKALDWKSALAYAENLEFAGYDDWKLPNIKELQSIVDYSEDYPAINKYFFETTDKNAYFWSSTSAYDSKESPEKMKNYWAWYVAFGYAVDNQGNDLHGAGATRYDTKYINGPTGEDAERIYNYARAVRKYK